MNSATVTFDDTASDAARIIWCTPETGLAIVRNVLVFRDEATPTPTTVRDLRDQILEVGSAYPRDGVYLFYVSPNVDADYPDEDTRAAFLEMLRSTRTVLRGTMYSILRGGILGTTIRALARAILHAARVTDEAIVARDLDDGAAWIAARGLATPAELIATWHRLGALGQETSGARPVSRPAAALEPTD